MRMMKLRRGCLGHAKNLYGAVSLVARIWGYRNLALERLVGLLMYVPRSIVEFGSCAGDPVFFYAT